MFTELFCLNGEFQIAGGKTYKGQFFAVVLEPEEMVCLIAEHSVSPDEAVVWFNHQLERQKDDFWSRFGEIKSELEVMPLRRYAPHLTVVFVSPDLHTIHIPDQISLYGLETGSRWQLRETKSASFTKISALGLLYREVLVRFPALYPAGPFGAKLMMLARINIREVSGCLAFENVASRIHDAYLRPEGATDDDLVRAVFVSLVFDEIQARPNLNPMTYEFPYPNRDELQSEFDTRLESKIARLPYLYPIDSLIDNEVAMRVGNAVQVLSALDDLGDVELRKRMSSALSDDEVCESLLAADFSIKCGFAAKSFEVLADELKERINGQFQYRLGY